MKFTIQAILNLILLFFISSCTSPYDIGIEYEDRKYVIGYIEANATIKLKYGSTKPSLADTNDVIVLLEDNLIFDTLKYSQFDLEFNPFDSTMIFKNRNPKYISSNPNKIINQNKNYSITLNGERKYEFADIPPLPLIDSIVMDTAIRISETKRVDLGYIYINKNDVNKYFAIQGILDLEIYGKVITGLNVDIQNYCGTASNYFFDQNYSSFTTKCQISNTKIVKYSTESFGITSEDRINKAQIKVCAIDPIYAEFNSKVQISFEGTEFFTSPKNKTVFPYEDNKIYGALGSLSCKIYDVKLR